MGNGLIDNKTPNKKLLIFEGEAIALQMIEGYWYLSMGSTNPGTQLKLSSALTSSIFAILTYRWIVSENNWNSKFLHLLGDCSFGIYFSHIVIMKVFYLIPGYFQFVIYPFNAVVIVTISLVFVVIGRKIFGKYAKYLAFG